MTDSSDTSAESGGGSSLSLPPTTREQHPESEKSSRSDPSAESQILGHEIVDQDEATQSSRSHDSILRDGLSSDAGQETQTFISRQNPESDSEFYTQQENDKTKVSERPVAAPAEFYRSMPLAELAGMLEGKRLDHFTVEQMIGGGGMGAVFRGRDLRLDRLVAIKVIPGSKRDPETLRRFRLEAQAAARLDHPNIARVYYVGEAEQWNYIVFEFIDGVNIRDLVSMSGPLTVDDAVYYVRQIAEALQHAHEREVVHRDIKPSNILVTANGTAKVVDMGLARSLGMDQSTADATASGVTLGTFDYISPEQARNPRDADVRSDLYSLGCSLFFMLTENPPFPEGTVLQKLLKHGSVPPPDPRGWRDDISDQLYSIIMKLMAKQPSQRYQKPAELVNDLMLLAEIEELPRSQSPGTMMFAPTLAHKSLLESNLSWIVALAFLLGSTLWLQSLQALSQGYDLRPLDFAELETLPVTSTGEVRPDQTPPLVSEPNERPEVLPEPPDVASGENGIGAVPDIPRPIVVSEIQPADVAVDSWSRTLREALSRLDGELQREIEVRGIIELNEPLRIDKAVTIRGAESTRAKILLESPLMRRIEGGRGAIQIADSQVEIRGLDIYAAGGQSSSRIGVFDVQGNSQLDLYETQVTLDDATGRLCAFIVDETSYLAPEVQDVDAKRMAVSLENCDVRGYGSLFGALVDLDRNDRLALSVTQSLIVVSEHVVHVQNAIGGWGDETVRNLRLFCEESTFYSLKSFAQIEYLDISQPLLSLNRTSRSSVFASPVGVSHVTVRGLGQDSMLMSLNRFLLKGSDNAYETEVLCKCYDPEDTEIFTFGFSEASQDGWLDERGNEFEIGWLRKPDVSLNLAETTRADFEVADGPFSPGFGSKSQIPSF